MKIPGQNLRPLPTRYGNQKGSFLVILALSLTVLAGIVVLAMEMTKLYMVRTALQNVSTLSSMAAVKALVTAPPKLADEKKTYLAQAAAIGIAKVNRIPFQNKPPVVTVGDIEFQKYDFKHKTITPAENISETNAVRVHVRQAGGANEATPLSFGRLFGKEEVAMQADSVSAVLPPAVALVFDNSASMTRKTYPVECDTADPKWQDIKDRYFKTAAWPEKDEKNCRGGKPQPLYDGLAAILPALNESILFMGPQYYLSFLSFSKDVKVHEDFKRENKEKVRDAIQDILGEWSEYASSKAKHPLHEAQEMPVSGLDPYNDGYTNTGAAIDRGIELLDELDKSFQLHRMIIVITDGAPTCSGKTGPCNNSAELRGPAETYAKGRAVQAGKQGYPIHMIYFNTSGDTCSSSDRAYRLSAEIASLTNGTMQCVTSPGQITEALDKIPVGLAPVQYKIKVDD